MVRGRKPKSAELKLLGGNAGKRPINDDAPKPSLTKNTKPFPWLSKAAKEFWRRTVPEHVLSKISTKSKIPRIPAKISNSPCKGGKLGAGQRIERPLGPFSTFQFNAFMSPATSLRQKLSKWSVHPNLIH